MPAFDQYDQTYADEVQAAVGRFAEHRVATEAKAEAVVELARRHVGDPAQLAALDVGCGPGTTDGLLVQSFASLHGVDVSEPMIERARDANPAAEYAAYDGEHLPFEDGQFDVVFTICVMHHIPPHQWPSFTREMARVTRPGGIVVVGEHNPFNPATRVIVGRCAWDNDAVLLREGTTKHLLAQAGLELLESRFILFSPWRGTGTRRIEQLLGRVPLGAQYVSAARHP